MAYAAVISLKHTIQRLTDISEITNPAYEELKSLGDILRRLDTTRNRRIDRNAINALDAEIREAVWKLEDVLEFQPSESLDKKGVEQEIDSFLKTVKKLEKDYIAALCNPLPRQEQEEVVNFVRKKKSTMVGLSDQFEQIRKDFQDWQSGLDSVSLVGMAGIGKTHLAREIFQHPTIVQNFDLTVWASVGRQQEVKNVWVDIVAQVDRKPKHLYMETNIITLVNILQKRLRGRRYLIVLDDIWSTEVCDSLIRFLRADDGNGNGRRLLLTTRLEGVAKYFKTRIHQMRFLNNEESWNLLKENVFVFDDDDEYFPPQLEKAGRKIAEKCEGLPLLILTVADILCDHEKTEEYWKRVADSKTTTFTDAYDKISKVLLSSYEYLPQYLKACFLYMGVFPQSCEIPLSKLIYLLSVENFMETEPGKVMRTSEKDNSLKRKRPQSVVERTYIARGGKYLRPFENLYLVEPGKSLTGVVRVFGENDLWEWEPHPSEVIRDKKTSITRTLEPQNLAMGYVEELVSNSVAIVCKQSSRNRIKFIKLHSAYWHLCVKEARNNKFFHVLKKLTDGSKDYIERQRRLSVQNNILFGIREVYDSMAATSTLRSLLCTGPDHEFPVRICFDLTLLKVLDALSIRFYEFPEEVVKLLQLRYLALTHYGKLPPSISKLQQLQFLIVGQQHEIRFLSDSIRLTKEMRKEIRDMQQLWNTKVLGDSTCLPKEIWEKICDMQEMWGTSVLRNSIWFTKDIWMKLLMCWMQGEKRTKLPSISSFFRRRLIRKMNRVWSTKLMRGSTTFPNEIWVEIWGKIWDMQEMWSTKLRRDSLSLLKKIWEKIWDIQEVRRTKLLTDSTLLPNEIWDMTKLRHLRIMGRNLPDPSNGSRLQNLSTLYVNAHSCTEDVFIGIPFLNKLGIVIELQPDAAETLSFEYIRLLNELESLKCVVVNPRLRSQFVDLSDHLLNLPRSLKKLSLNGLGYSWNYMIAIGSLPNLQVLKLRCSAFQGPEWELEFGEFQTLEFLLLEDIDLVHWRINNNMCFPRLRRLIIGHCYKLKEIPRRIGAIPTMKMIEVVDCSPSVVASARQLHHEFSVEVVINSSWNFR